MFKKTTDQKKPLASTKRSAITPAIHPVEALDVLIAEKKLTLLIERIRLLAHISEKYWDLLYLPALSHYVEFVQSLPAISYPQFNKNKGLLELGIRRCIESLLLHRKYHPTQHKKPEQLSPQEALITYALFTASLFYGLGHVGANYWVSLCDSQGFHGKRWNPIAGSMQTQGTYYRCSFEAFNRDQFSNYMTPIFAKNLMPQLGFVWISQDRELFEAWLAFLQNDIERGGLFAKMILPFEGIFFDPSKQYAYESFDIDWVEDIMEEDEKEKLLGLDDHEFSLYFIKWLKHAIRGKHGIQGIKLSLNQSNSLLHYTEEGLLFAYPELLNAFIKKHPNFKNPMQIAKRLQQAGVAELTLRQYRLDVLSKDKKNSMGMILDPTLISTIISPSKQNLQFETARQHIQYPDIVQESLEKKL
jgi:hypothetical protein